MYRPPVIPLTLDFTPEGSQLAKRLPRVTSHTRKDSQLEAALRKSMARFAQAWQRGLERADEHGRAAVKLLDSQLAREALSADLSPEQAALLASVVGAYESSDLFPCAEFLWRARGPAFCVDVLVQMWRFATSYRESGRALWLTELADEARQRLDASVSYAKGRMGSFLYERGQHATDEQRAELIKAADAYREAPAHVQVPVAYAARDPAWADRLIDHMRAGQPLGFYADQLIHVTEDVDRIRWYLDARRATLGLSFILRLPLETTLSLYEHQLRSKLPNTIKTGLVEQLGNVRGSAVAKLVIPFAETRAFRAHVRAYFVRHPDLLEEIVEAPGEDVDPKALASLHKAVEKARAKGAK